MEFFSRHASTLSGIVLDFIKLTKGSWPRLLQKMRKILCQKEAIVHGLITSNDPEEDFDFGFSLEYNDGVPGVLSIAVERYLMLGGDGPLLNLSALSSLEAEDEDSGFWSDWVCKDMI